MSGKDPHEYKGIYLSFLILSISLKTPFEDCIYFSQYSIPMSCPYSCPRHSRHLCLCSLWLTVQDIPVHNSGSAKLSQSVQVLCSLSVGFCPQVLCLHDCQNRRGSDFGCYVFLFSCSSRSRFGRVC